MLCLWGLVSQIKLLISARFPVGQSALFPVRARPLARGSVSGRCFSSFPLNPDFSLGFCSVLGSVSEPKPPSSLSLCSLVQVLYKFSDFSRCCRLAVVSADGLASLSCNTECHISPVLLVFLVTAPTGSRISVARTTIYKTCNKCAL